jgi:hypothetical protein
MYTTVPIPDNIDIAKLIGRGGQNLKNITERSGCWYMWVDSHQKVVEIWGRDEHMAMGIATIKNRFRKMTPVVTSWESGYRTFYKIVGSEDECKKVFDKLCKEYPFNPYMTQIEKKTEDGLLVFRFSSCD